MKSSLLPSILLEVLKVESVNIETGLTPAGLFHPDLFYFARNLKTYGTSLVEALSKDWKQDLEQAALFPEWAPLFGFRLVTKHVGGDGPPEVKLF